MLNHLVAAVAVVDDAPFDVEAQVKSDGEDYRRDSDDERQQQNH